MISVIVKSGPYSTSRVKEGLRMAVSLTIDEEVEVLLYGPGKRCLDAEGDDWADEIQEHLDTIEELGTLTIGRGHLEDLLLEADRAITI